MQIKETILDAKAAEEGLYPVVLIFMTAAIATGATLGVIWLYL